MADMARSIWACNFCAWNSSWDSRLCEPAEKAVRMAPSHTLEHRKAGPCYDIFWPAHVELGFLQSDKPRNLRGRLESGCRHRQSIRFCPYSLGELVGLGGLENAASGTQPELTRLETDA